MSRFLKAGSRVLRPSTPSLILPRSTPAISRFASNAPNVHNHAASTNPAHAAAATSSAPASGSSSSGSSSKSARSSTSLSAEQLLRQPVPLFSDPTSTRTTGPASLLSYPLTKVTRLSNGLRVASGAAAARLPQLAFGLIRAAATRTRSPTESLTSSST